MRILINLIILLICTNLIQSCTDDEEVKHSNVLLRYEDLPITVIIVLVGIMIILISGIMVGATSIYIE